MGPVTADLAGPVTDDGFPKGSNLSTFWSLAAGPARLSVSNPTATFPNNAVQINSVTTAATFSATGTYVARLTASDSSLSSSADLTVTVEPVGTLTDLYATFGRQGQQNISVWMTGQ